MSESIVMPAGTQEEKIAKALAVAVSFGGIDGAHHKDWVIDQMVRALTGCPLETGHSVDSRGNSYTYQSQGESPEYTDLVRDACAGEDGPQTYGWETGIPP